MKSLGNLPKRFVRQIQGSTNEVEGLDLRGSDTSKLRIIEKNVHDGMYMINKMYVLFLILL